MLKAISNHSLNAVTYRIQVDIFIVFKQESDGQNSEQ